MTRTAHLFILGMTLLAAFSSCKTETPREKSPTPTPSNATLSKIKALTKAAYAIKKEGNNQGALAEFKNLAHIIKDELQADPFETASNLDDQASVFLRMGQSETAYKQYTQARDMLEDLEGERAAELLEGVRFRLRILAALNEKGVTCMESPTYNNPDIPYFLDLKEAHKAIAKSNPIVRDCFEGPAKPVTVSMIITGQGQIVMTNPRGPKIDTSVGICVANRLLKLGKIDGFPQFGACFRPYSYPFAVGG